MPKNIDRYLVLKEKAYEAQKKFNEASEFLKKGYFIEVDFEIKKIETELENEFYNLASQNIREILTIFRFRYNPFNIIGEVGMMKKPDSKHNLYYDLDDYASEIEQEHRVHEMMMQKNKNYRETFNKMEEELIRLGLHPAGRPCKNKNLEKFMEENNVFGFVPVFSKEE